MTSALDRIAGFVEDLRWDGIPQAARTRARLALRDTIGTMLGGAATTAGKVAAAVARRQPGPAVLVGHGGGSVPHLAALANAVAASALDFDDGHYRGGAIHPGSVVVPAVLAAADAPGVGLEDLLTAQVAGYEVGLRAAHLLWPKHADDDYHCTGTAATLGAAAAVAKLRGHDADLIGRSIAIAWAHAPMSTFQLPMVKESIGWSAATGVNAVELAEAGFMAMRSSYRPTPPDVLPPTPFDRRGVADDPFVWSFGQVFEAANTYFKPFAACRYTHAAAGGLRRIMAESGLSAGDLAGIDVGTHAGAVFLGDQTPPTLEHAQYSFPFALSAIALHGEAGAREIAEDRLDDPERLDLCGRIAVRHDPELDAHYPAHYASSLDVRLRDGSTLSGTFLVAPGDPQDPLSEADLEAKFLRLAAPALGETEAKGLAADLVTPGALTPADLLARLP
jgi:2-methylcitrate dehydratase PrpD